MKLAALIALGWSCASVLTAAAWSALRTVEKRHLAKSRANARAGLAAMGADCPDDGEGYALPFNCADHADWDKWELELAMGRHPSSGGLW